MLCENIKTLRKTKGLSQEELANQLNVVRQTVSKWEKGLSVPDAGMLIKIAEALGTTVNALLGEEITEPEDRNEIKVLSEKLEIINEKLAAQAECRRKMWRSLSVIAGVLALATFARVIVPWFFGLQATSRLQYSVGIIGGADGPTSILVSGEMPDVLKIAAASIAMIVSFIGIYRTKK